MHPEVLRLVSIGFPLEDALTLYYSMSKEGNIKEFVEEQEKLHREKVMIRNGLQLL